MMGTIALICRLVLAAVFILAAVTKVLDRPGTREAVIGFGAPERAAGVLALLVPAAELVAGALLLPAATAVGGAVVSLILLAVFSAAVTINLAHGRTPDCHCFGQLHSTPAGPKTLARNGALAALGGFVLVADGGSTVPAGAWIAVGGVAVVAIVVAALLVSLRAYGRLLLRIDHLEQALADAGIDPGDGVTLDVIPAQAGLAPGTEAPAFEVEDTLGHRASLTDLLAPRLPLAMVFASPGCGPCSALMPILAEWQHDHRDRLTIAVASDGPVDDVRAKAEEAGLERVLHDADGRLYDAFAANGTPGAVLIDPDGRIASRVASGAEEIEALVRHVVDAPGLPVGTSVPELELTTMDGEGIALGAPSRTGTLVVFWNPDCGYCRRIHDPVRAWEETDDAERPRLVIISSGDAARTGEEGFHSSVVLDPEFSVAGVFGAAGTPSAILLDADGRVASSIAVGSPAVLALAGIEAAVMTR